MKRSAPRPQAAPPTKGCEFRHNVFTTAIEGGITYWAAITRYRWSKDGTLDGIDWYAYSADVYDIEDDTERYVINDTVLRAGLARLSIGPITGLAEQHRATILGAYWINDAGDIDAQLADVIVQIGLFGEVRYG